jgi:parallel beta-helix repeat protein
VLLDRPGPANRHNSILEVESFDHTISYWTIEGVEVAGSPRYGIDLRHTDHVTVRGCCAHDSAVTGIVTSFSEYVTIESNECYRNHEHGIYHANSADHPIIRGNRIHHNDTCGLHMNGDASLGGDGQISYALVEKNIIWENGAPGGGSAINCDGVSDSVFRNNLCVGNHASGISLYAGDGAAGSSRNQVYNNTFLMAPESRWVVNIPASQDGKPDPIGNTVKNNVLYTPFPERGSIHVYDPAAAHLESDYNAVVDRFTADNDVSIISLREWRAYGFDQHSIQITPDALTSSESPARADACRPRPGSPLVGAGVALPGVTDDLGGAARPATPCIGCYEPPASD